MHLHGINTRYLGYIYTLLKVNEEMKVLVLTEAVARVLKHEMEERYARDGTDRVFWSVCLFV
jgi:hypothetical protein